MNKVEKSIVAKLIDIESIECDLTAIKEVIREVTSNIDEDFNVDVNGTEYRVINESEIDSIMCDELENDLYILGCFNDWFLSNVLEIDVDVIRAMQEAEAFEALGKLILSMNKLAELQSEYVSADGYGHHFNSYDGNEWNTASVEGNSYYIFRV